MGDLCPISVRPLPTFGVSKVFPAIQQRPLLPSLTRTSRRGSAATVLGMRGVLRRSQKELSTKGHEGLRRHTKKDSEKQFLCQQAAAVGTIKLQWFGATPRGYRFSASNLFNFFRKSVMVVSENRCILPLGKSRTCWLTIGSGGYSVTFTSGLSPVPLSRFQSLICEPDVRFFRISTLQSNHGPRTQVPFAFVDDSFGTGTCQKNAPFHGALRNAD